MPAHAQSTSRRLVLVPAASVAARPGPARDAVRRYRLGRLGFAPPPGDDRYGYLKRGHD